VGEKKNQASAALAPRKS